MDYEKIANGGGEEGKKTYLVVIEIDYFFNKCDHDACTGIIKYFTKKTGNYFEEEIYDKVKEYHEQQNMGLNLSYHDYKCFGDVRVWYIQASVIDTYNVDFKEIEEKYETHKCAICDSIVPEKEMKSKHFDDSGERIVLWFCARCLIHNVYSKFDRSK